MKGSAKLVMGATLILIVSLAIVLALILVLLAELYCSLLFRKRRYRTNTATTATTTTAAASPQASLHSSTTSVQMNSVYAHGVFLAPRNILYPSIIHKQEEEICKSQGKDQFFKPYDHQSHHHHHHHHHQVLDILNLDPNNTPSPFSSLTASPATMQQIHHQEAAESEITHVRSNIGSVCSADEHLVYISNPIYDNELSYNKHGGVEEEEGGSGISSNATPFETPESSPSHLELGWEEEEEADGDRNEKGSSPNSSLETMTPPLTPMKKLQRMEACSSSVSVSLRDARSIDTSGSSHGLSCSSSLSTSPSW